MTAEFTAATEAGRDLYGRRKDLKILKINIKDINAKFYSN